MQAKAQKKYIRISPRKLRLIVRSIKGLPLGDALAKLRFVNKKGAKILTEVLKQAIDNATSSLKLDVGNLRFKEILVDEGPRYKRRDKSHGARFDSGIIRKKTAHLKIVLEEKHRTEDLKPRTKTEKIENRGKKGSEYGSKD